MTQDMGTLTDDLGNLILRNAPSPATASIILNEWYRQRRYDEVIKACRDLLKFYPDDIGLRRIACLAYSALDFHQEVLIETEEIMHGIDGFADIFLLRARVLKRLNRREEALDALDVYLSFRRGDEAGIELLREFQGVAPGPGSDETSVEGRAPGETPFMASATIAELYVSQGLVDDAVRTYRLVVTQNPDNEDARRRLEELESQLPPVSGEDGHSGDSSSEAGFKAILEQWRATCRKAFGTMVPTESQGGAQ